MLECIRADVRGLVRAGRVYECAEVFTGFGSCSFCGVAGPAPGVILLGVGPIICGAVRGGFCVCLFKPAGHRGMFDHLLKTEPVKEAQDA